MALFSLNDIIESPTKTWQRVEPLLPPQVTHDQEAEPQQGSSLSKPPGGTTATRQVPALRLSSLWPPSRQPIMLMALFSSLSTPPHPHPPRSTAASLPPAVWGRRPGIHARPAQRRFGRRPRPAESERLNPPGDALSPTDADVSSLWAQTSAPS